MNDYAVKKKTTPEDGVKEFLSELLSKELIDALFAAAVTPWSQLPMPHLFTSFHNLDRLAPLSPAAPFNSARQAAQVLRESTGKKIAVVLRPCEIRALIELSKLNQCVLDDLVIIIGIECMGRLENKVFLDGVKQDPDFVSSFYKKEKMRENIADACKGCVDFFPEQADISFLTVDRQEDALFFAINSEKGQCLADQTSLEHIPPSEYPSQKRTNLFDALKNRRTEKNTAQLKTTNKIMGSLADFQKIFATCINCYNCRNACPVCYCKACVFSTDVFDLKPDILLKRAEKNSGIKLPQDTTMFHMTRMLHIGHACVGCGQCTSACPQSIPVADFFRAAAEKTQQVYRYKPGRSKEEKIPMLFFGESDGK